MRTSTLLCALACLIALNLATTYTAYAQYDCGGQNEVIVKDCEALIAVYQATTISEPWSHGTGFWQAVDNDPNNDLPISQWSTTEAVQIAGNRVVHVDFKGNNLNGTLPEAICDLDALRELDLGLNKVTGTLPTCIGNMTALEKISIKQFDFNLSGTLPESLGDLVNLKRLDIPGNEFTGPIPASLGNLINLEYLVLGGSLGLSGNQLSGPIPESLGQLTSLIALILTENNLSGPIPESLGNLSNLTDLSLRGNTLSGTIPASLANLTKLERLVLNGNELTGFEPGSYTQWSSLNYLSLSSNQLTEIPALSGLNSLEYLLLAANELASLPDLSALNAGTNIDLRWNTLTFGDMASLTGFVGQPGFQYIPQYSTPIQQLTEDGNTVLWFDAGDGESTVYEWRRFDVEANRYLTIEGATDSTYTVTESGRYLSIATNTMFPDLTISGIAIDVEVDGCSAGKIEAGCGFIVNIANDNGFPPKNDGTPDLPADGLCDVDPNTDNNQCSLRAALQLANAGFGKNNQVPVIIAFEIAGDPVIQLASVLPEITKPVEIAGSLQSGGFVVVQGEGKSFRGLVIQAGGRGSTIDGLNLSDFDVGINVVGGGENTISSCVLTENGTGVQISSSSNNRIRDNMISENDEEGIAIEIDSEPFKAQENQIIDNKIGTDVSGTQARGNGGHGISLVGTSRNMITRNLISANRKDGIYLDESTASASMNIIENNKIGTDLTGSLGLPNKNGIELGRSYANSIRNNTISGNSGAGIFIYFGQKDTLSSNIIGLGSAGTTPVPNSTGIRLLGASATIIQDNVVASNVRNGIGIDQRGDFGATTITSNKIGTDITGTLPRGNGAYGISINAPKTSVLQNVVSANGEGGIHVLPESDATRILDNKIGSTIQGDLDDNLLIANRGDGVRIDRAKDVNVNNNLIAYNLGRGVLLRQTQNGTVWQNTLQENSHGIEIDEGQAVQVRSNRIQKNRQSGVLLHDLLGGTVSYNTIQDNRYGIENDGGQDLDVKDNIIWSSSESGILLRDAGGGNVEYNDFYGNRYGIEIDGGQAVKISHNEFDRNLKKAIFARNIGDVERFTSLTIVGNEIVQTQSQTTGIHLLNAHARITGNTITEDVGDAIKLEDGSTAQIVGNNIFGNAGMGLNNLSPSVMVTATDNWWGDASGPGGQGPGAGDVVSEGVNFSNWLGEMVAVVTSAEADSMLLPIGEPDTVSVFVQNWQVRDDALDLTISDTEGWLQSPAALTVTLEDSTGAEARLAVSVPVGMPNGTTSTVEVTAISQTDDSHTATTTFTLIAESAALAQVLVLPGTANVAPGDTIAFDALGLDQFSRTVEIAPTWTATGGQIDSNGVYIAGTTSGEFVVTATDPATGLSGTAQVGNGIAVAVEDADDVPDAFHLAQNYPNPFNPETTIAFTLPQQAHVRLSVYDVLGREVATLIDDALPTGAHQARFDARGLFSGVYFYHLTADHFSQTRTMVLLR